MAAAPTAPANAAFLRSKLTSMRAMIGSLDNPRSRLAETWPSTVTPDAFLANWRGSLVKLGPDVAGGAAEWAVIQFALGNGGNVDVRIAGAAPVSVDRATLVGRSMKVARGCFARPDGTVVDAGVNASAVRLKATGEAAILVQNAAPDDQISIRLPSSGAQIMCAPQDLDGMVDIAAGDWVSNEVVSRLTALMTQEEATRVVNGLVQVIGQAKAQRAVLTLQQLGVYSSMAGPGLARALTELTLCLAGVVGEVGRAAQVVDGVTDSARADGARLGDEAFRNNSLGFIVEGIELLISAADEGLASAAAARIAAVGPLSSGTAAFAGTTLGSVIAAAVSAAAHPPAGLVVGAPGPAPAASAGGVVGDPHLLLFTPAALVSKTAVEVLAALDATAGTPNAVGDTLALARKSKVPKTTLGAVAASLAALSALRSIITELEVTPPDPGGAEPEWGALRAEWAAVPPPDNTESLSRIHRVVELVAAAREQQGHAGSSGAGSSSTFSGRVKDLPQEKWEKTGSHDPLAVDPSVADQAATDQAIIAEHLAARRVGVPAATAPLELRRLRVGAAEGGAGFGQAAAALVTSNGKTNGALAPTPQSLHRAHTNLLAHCVKLGSEAVSEGDMATQLTAPVKARSWEALTGGVRRLAPWIELYGGTPSLPDAEDVRDLFPEFGTLEGGDPKSVESTVKALGVLNAKLWDVWGVGVGLRHVTLPHSTATAFAAQTMSFQLPAVYRIMRDRHLPHDIIVTQLERQLSSFANEAVAWRQLLGAKTPSLADKLEKIMETDHMHRVRHAAAISASQKAAEERQEKRLQTSEARMAAMVADAQKLQSRPLRETDKKTTAAGVTSPAGKLRSPKVNPTVDNGTAASGAGKSVSSPADGSGASTGKPAGILKKPTAPAGAGADTAPDATATTRAGDGGDVSAESQATSGGGAASAQGRQLQGRDRDRYDLSRKLAEDPSFQLKQRRQLHLAMESMLAADLQVDEDKWPCTARALRRTHKDCQPENGQPPCSKCAAAPYNPEVEGKILARVRARCDRELAKTLPAE